ncbi:MAG: macro domain-containing protein [Candidatus Marinimicrobia bacterium]|nr:macro domain-containing protein [Candidatus Neomarinimicrobiota bacterium]
MIDQVTIEIIQGDIANQKDIDAVVNAANASLMPGGGVAGAIHRVAGPQLAEACKPLAPIKPGEAIITPAFHLPNKYVIHCLGPVYGVDKPERTLLAQCYKNALNLAEKYAISSIAFPAISTGYFGYPFQEAAKITFETISHAVKELKHVKKIRFVLYSKKDLEVYKKISKSYL